MRRSPAHRLTLAAITAAVYAALTILIPGPSFGFTQFRVAEALTVLPYLFPATASGLAVGCLIANLLSPYGPLDLLFGTLATALAAFLTMKMPSKWLAPLPPVLCNAILVGGTQAWYAAGFGPSFLGMFVLSGTGVALGEIGACYILGLLLLTVLSKIKFLHPKTR